MNPPNIKVKYDKMLENLAELNLLQRVVDQAFKRELETIEKYREDTRADGVISHDAFMFKNPLTGQLEKYAFKKTTIEDLKEITIWHKNSQYCWLLMSAYEKFEAFLKDSYYNLTNENEPRKLNKILYYFSENFPEFKKHESDNPLGIHLRIAVNLVEKMRHAIVHEQGVVLDVNKFSDKIIKDSGINNDKAYHKEFASQFIVKNKVFIIEVPANYDARLKRFGVYHDQYRCLVSFLIAYAYLVVTDTQLNTL